MRLWFLFFLLMSSWASADTLSAIGGVTFGRNTGLNDLKTPLLGMEYTIPVLSKVQLGGFFNHEGLTASNGENDTLSFMGLMLRFDPGPPESIKPFLDVRAGMAQRSNAANNTQSNSNMEFSYGAGVGVRFPVSKVISISPRVDVNYLPDSTSSSAGHQAVVDGAMLFSIHL